jgi:hypothetical protein
VRGAALAALAGRQFYTAELASADGSLAIAEATQACRLC